jgi:glycosyltransferase involved in cell wall biosynthesis
MRLLIDSVNVGSPGGLQNQVEIAQAAARRRPPGCDVVTLRSPSDYAIEPVPGLSEEFHPRASGWSGLRRWFHRELPRHAARHSADVVYSLSGILSRPLARSAATINSINNMLPFTPEHIRHFRPLTRDWLRLMILQRTFVSSSRLADALIVPSRHGLERVNHYAGDLTGKAFIAMNPVPEYAKFRPASPPPHPYEGRPFLFYLSAVYWYKNHLELIEGYRRVLARGEDLPDLLMAGLPEDAAYVARIERAIADSGFSSRIRYLGKIPREDIPGLLHHATINVFPSTCETNSFVQNEILGAHGVMACSKIPPMPEVAGPAAELFDPRDPDSIGETLLRLSRDEGRRAELRRLAAARAAEFTWDACGDAMWKAAQHALAARAARNGSSR